MAQEIELKFLVRHPDEIEKRLRKIGAIQVHPRLFEQNLLFDDSRGSVRSRGGILRLRKIGDKAVLTVKLPPDTPSTEAKIRREYQVEVSDFEEARRLLEALGFEQRGGYEKFREEFRLGGVSVTLDEMPFGHFVEIEGGLEEIKAAAQALGLDLDKRILGGYPTLIAAVRNALGLDLPFLTFENWRQEIDWGRLGIEPADG